MTVVDYAARWLALEAQRLRPSTVTRYRSFLKFYVLPHLPKKGRIPLEAVTRRMLLDAFGSQLARGLKPNTVRCGLCAIRALYNAAIDDELIEKNPAARLGKRLFRGRLGFTGVAMTAAEFAAFDRAARHLHVRQRRLWVFLERTGTRLGEALGITWEDINLEKRTAWIRRTWTDTSVGPTKSGRERQIDLSRQTVALLAGLPRTAAPFVWRNPPWRRRQVEKQFKKVAAFAQLSPAYVPHSLRHTFATIAKERGCPLEWIKEQLGHASIAITSDLYARHRPIRNPELVDRLDEGSQRPRPAPARHAPRTRKRA